MPPRRAPRGRVRAAAAAIFRATLRELFGPSRNAVESLDLPHLMVTCPESIHALLTTNYNTYSPSVVSRSL